jgi:flagellar basal-body rod modification protein FlgD
MMATQSVSQSGAAATAAAAQLPGQMLTKDDFLKLLVTQLRHQDPLNPLDQNQFLSQTAQFTSLEQLQNISAALENLAAANTSSGVAEAAILLGKTARVAGSGVALSAGGSAELAYTIEGQPAPVHIEILDPRGAVVRTLEVNPGTTGTFTATWDGKDGAGTRLTAGNYYYRVSPLTGAGGAETIVSVTQGVLSGFEITGGAVRYRLGSVLIRPEDIIDVRL